MLTALEKRSKMDYDALIERAMAAREKAYAPYSRFSVGAALEAVSGNVYLGCNVENASFSATCCAERTAFQSAIVNGEKQFKRIAIVGGTMDDPVRSPCMPCGICRQVMREFCDDAFEIVVSDGANTSIYSLAEILPGAFSKKNLNGPEA